jgi:hypothetical protein
MVRINKEKQEKLNWDYLHNILDYDEDTGIFKWKVRKGNSIYVGDIAGSFYTSGYRRIIINGIDYKEHRLAWYYVYAKWPEKLIDHIDGIKYNNAISNLREVTNSENMQNQKTAMKNKTSGSSIPGVYFYRNNNKYCAQLQINGKLKSFGSYSTIEEAESICIEMRRKYYAGNTI